MDALLVQIVSVEASFAFTFPCKSPVISYEPAYPCFPFLASGPNNRDNMFAGCHACLASQIAQLIESFDGPRMQILFSPQHHYSHTFSLFNRIPS